VVIFREFYATWHGRVQAVSNPELARDLYFLEQRDKTGFDLLPDFIKERGEEWAVLVASVFEKRSSLAGRLDSLDMAKFRMVFDRHMVNLSKAAFDDDYHSSSDERALFLIHTKIPPVRVCSALTAAKNETIDMIVNGSDGPLNENEIALISALSTIFMIEINHIMRVYVYYAKYNPEKQKIFEVTMDGDDAAQLDYEPPSSNSQMSYPDKSKFGLMEMF